MTGPSRRVENLHIVVPRLVGVVAAIARAQQQLTAAPRSPPSGVRRRASRRRRHDRVAVAPPVVAESTAAAPRSCPAAGRVGSCPPPRPRRPMSSDCCPMRRRAAAPLPARGTGGWRPDDTRVMPIPAPKNEDSARGDGDVAGSCRRRCDSAKSSPRSPTCAQHQESFS